MMRIPVGVALLTLGLVALAPLGARGQDLPIPQEWSTHYVVLLVANRAYAPASPEQERALTAAHIQYQLRLQQSGLSIAAGGLGEGTGEALVGLTVLRAGSLQEARTLAEADPAVCAGRLTAWVREWWVPADRLP